MASEQSPSSPPIQRLPNELITLIFLVGSELSLADQEGIFSNPPGKHFRKPFIKLVRLICRHWRDLVDHINPLYEQSFWITNIPLRYKHTVTSSLSRSIIEFKGALSRAEEGELALHLVYHDITLIRCASPHGEAAITPDLHGQTYLKVRLLIHALGLLREHRTRISIMKSSITFLPIMAGLMQMLYEDIPPSPLSILILESPRGMASVLPMVGLSRDFFYYQPTMGTTRLWPPETYPTWRKVDSISLAHPSLSLHCQDVRWLQYLGLLANIITSLVIEVDVNTISELPDSERRSFAKSIELWRDADSSLEPEINSLLDNGAARSISHSPATQNAHATTHNSTIPPRPIHPDTKDYWEDMRVKLRNGFRFLTRLDLILRHPTPFEYPIVRLFESSPLDSLKISWEPVGASKYYHEIPNPELRREALERMSRVQASAWKIRRCELSALSESFEAHEYFVWLVDGILRYSCSSHVETMTLRSQGLYWSPTMADLPQRLRFPQLQEMTLDLAEETMRQFLRDNTYLSPNLKVIHLVHRLSIWPFNQRPFNIHHWHLNAVHGLQVLDLQLTLHPTWTANLVCGLANYLMESLELTELADHHAKYLAGRRGDSSTATFSRSFPNPELEVVVFRPVSYPVTPIYLLTQKAIRYDSSRDIFGDGLINLLHRAIRTRLEEGGIPPFAAYIEYETVVYRI
jgi:hypothetical protein